MCLRVAAVSRPMGGSHGGSHGPQGPLGPAGISQGPPWSPQGAQGVPGPPGPLALWHRVVFDFLALWHRVVFDFLALGTQEKTRREAQDPHLDIGHGRCPVQQKPTASCL